MAVDIDAIVTLGKFLRKEDYHFVTITPASHRRMLERPPSPNPSLRDIFGWNRSFDASLVNREIWDVLTQSDLVTREPDGFKSRIRFSTLGANLFAHSSYPTTARDSVFFGPDTYRFVSFLNRTFRPTPRVVDVGCGSGAGGLAIASQVENVVLSDVNENALVFAKANALLQDFKVEFAHGDLLDGVQGTYQAVIANPPFIIDKDNRAYRDGGGALGTDIALRMVTTSLERLGESGTLYLYTGVPIVEGNDIFRNHLETIFRKRGIAWSYEEIDPDIFGEELSSEPYWQVERIAAVGVVARLPPFRPNG